MKLNPQQAPLYVSIIIHASSHPHTPPPHLLPALPPTTLVQDRVSGTNVLSMDGVL